MGVIVVGNGKIENQQKLIDSYDEIIRLNWLKHLSDSVNRGILTTVWALTGNKKDILAGMRMYNITRVWHFHSELGNISKDFLRKCRDEVGTNPTTGYMAIMKALETFGSCDIIGFNFFQDKMDYWDENSREKIANLHDPEKEKSIIMNNKNVTFK